MGHLGRESWIPLALSLLAPAVVFAPPPNNGTATPTPPPTAAAAAVATSSSSSDNSLGYVFGILVAIGASIGFCVSIGMYVYGYYKGKYGNPKPRKKKKVPRSQEELDAERQERFGETEQLNHHTNAVYVAAAEPAQHHSHKVAKVDPAPSATEKTMT